MKNAVKQVPYLALLLLLPLLAACENDKNSLPQTINGPALIMFYTDG